MSQVTQSQVTESQDTQFQNSRQIFGTPLPRVLGGVALLACAIVLLCDVTMWFLVKGYNPISQTISELAAGPHHWLQDTGIVVFVIGTFCLAIDLFIRGEKGWKPWLVRIAMVLICVDIAMIALWNEYGDGVPGGLEIHIYLVALLYPLVPIILWFGTSVLPARHGKFSTIAKVTAIAWLALAPIFFILPTRIDGLYERFLGCIMIGAVAIAAWRLIDEPTPNHESEN
ncbi:DUF998 domain-containing protein [Litorimonas sp. RW-G-Af-16]|uniref:DUF998 domain-containing protein n=1 Tax=Litorimonas sp. RW-G-Af-16 TaxID=3241168 RepID=UPI00390C6060